MLGQDQSGLPAGESPPQGRRGKSGQILLRGGQLAPCQRQQDQLHQLGSSPSFQHEPNASRHFGSPGKGEVYFYSEKIFSILPVCDAQLRLKQTGKKTPFPQSEMDQLLGSSHHQPLLHLARETLTPILIVEGLSWIIALHFLL